VLNAIDACAKLGIDAHEMARRWSASKDANTLLKFGGGFYCGKIDATVTAIPAAPTGLFVINGFYMSMRDCYTQAGARIHYFDVDWDAEKLSWSDFRAKVLGATDPDAAAPTSLRGLIKAQREEFGLPGPCTVRDNGVHASASPFEAMAERVNWLQVKLEEDALSQALVELGVSVDTQLEWVNDPQVDFDEKKVSLFDTLEDLDTWPLLQRASKIANASYPAEEKRTVAPKNRAVVFIKPHACVDGDPVAKLVRDRFADEGIHIASEGDISSMDIDEKKLIDKHYGAIAAKASLLTPDQTNPSGKAKEAFGMAFDLHWDEALEHGLVKNAVDACKHLEITGSEMSDRWDRAKAEGKIIKFGGGFYCAKLM
jgi:nucleoside diphosphate kinase